MPVDASIYGQFQPAQQVNPLAALAQAYQVKAYQGASEKNDRELMQQNKLADLYQTAVGQDGSLDRQKLLTGAATSGLGAQIPTLQKGFSEQDKAAREAQKAELEGVIQKFDVGSRIMSTYDPTKPESWLGVRQQTAQFLGADAAARLPSQPPTPEEIQQNMNRAMSAKELAEQKYKELTFGETQRSNRANEGLRAESNVISRANNIDTVANSARTADMADSRSREANQNGRVPSGYRQLADGSLEFIQGGPADPNTKPAGGKPLNDTQAKALQFGSRMQQAEEVFSKLADEGVNASVPGSRSPVIGSVISALQPEARQELDQAKRNFINAVLRRESGAAIAPSEFDNADKQYFAQPGDSPKVREQKKANRELATRGILAEVPDSENRVSQVRGTPAAAKPAGGATRKVIGGKTYENDGKGWYAVN